MIVDKACRLNAADLSLEMERIEKALPARFGHVTISRRPETGARGLVVCISDLHSHIPVQRNMAELIQHLSYHHRFRLLCVEGASGEGDVSLIWSLPRRVRLSFCESLFRKGYLTGSEFAVVARPQLGLTLWGVDVPSLYKVQWRAFKENLASRPTFVVALLDSRRQMRRLYEPLVSRELIRLVRLQYAGDDHWTGWAHAHDNDQELEYLFKVAERRDLTLPSDLWSIWSQWRKRTTLEAADARSVSEGRQSVIAEMHSWIEDRYLPIKEILSGVDRVDLSSFQTSHWFNQISDKVAPNLQGLGGSAFSLESVLTKMPPVARGDLMKTYQKFWEEMATMPESLRRPYDITRTPSLWWTTSDEQRDQLWRIVAQDVCTTEVDEIVLRLEETYSLALKFLHLNMQTEESLAFITPGGRVGTRPGETSTSVNTPPCDAICAELMRDITRLNELGRSVCGGKQMPLDLIIALQAFWQTSETYYSVARQRSTGMAKNIANLLNQRRCERAVAISGGFHSRDISDWLTREAAMATMIICPAVGDSASEMKAAEYRYNRRGLDEE